MGKEIRLAAEQKISDTGQIVFMFTRPIHYVTVDDSSNEHG